MELSDAPEKTPVTGGQSRDPPISSAVPQPLHHPSPHLHAVRNTILQKKKFINYTAAISINYTTQVTGVHVFKMLMIQI
jgi:hypothetical protein